MKWMIASDIHGSEKYCRMLLEAYEIENADRLLLLGDLLYHGPRNDLPEEYSPKAVISMLNERREDILCVRGNCDTEVDQMVLDFPIMADYAAIDTGDYLIYATHGHHFNEDTPPPMKLGNILLCGHTHVSKCADHGDYIYMNPGSVSIPKDGTARGYMTLENGVFTWKTLAGDVINRWGRS